MGDKELVRNSESRIQNSVEEPGALALIALPPFGINESLCKFRDAVYTAASRRARLGDYSIFLWLLKLGALANLYFLVGTAARDADVYIVAPAQILFVVSAYR
jgi:hypothetical protein